MFYSTPYTSDIDEGFISTWPPYCLINHSCFSKIKNLTLHVTDLDEFSDDNPTNFSKIPIKLAYVTTLKAFKKDPNLWSTFYRCFCFPNLIDCIPQWVNVEKLKLDLTTYIGHSEGDSCETTICKRMVLANSFATEVFETSCFSKTLDK